MRSILAVSVWAAAAAAQQSAYGQCGGTGWTGATTCVAGYVCSSSKKDYSQCIPGEASSVSSAAPAPPATTLVPSTTTKPSATTSLPSGSSSASGPGSTLQAGYLWIRAVEAPNFHKYLQTKPSYSTGIAYLDSYTTAGQFQVVNGQLVQLTSSGLLYGNVIRNTTAAVKLQLAFNTTQNTFGTFAFSGDALQWSTPGITRPNLSAWLVCGSQTLWINLGNYDYMTPAGCADETIHYYNAATANGGN